MRLFKLNISFALKGNNLGLKTVIVVVAALVLTACSEQPDFKFVKFHPPAHMHDSSTSTSLKAAKKLRLSKRAYYKRKLQAQGFKVSRVGKWVQLDSPRSLLFKLESANYTPSAIYRLKLISHYMNTFDVSGLRVSVYGAPPKKPAYEQALTNRCAQVVASYLKSKQGNIRFSSALGYGVNDPIALNNTARGRAANKRVDIRFELQQADLVLI
jgi:outer membrane protein OmpA-like peptidoglycan-associated protein